MKMTSIKNVIKTLLFVLVCSFPARLSAQNCALTYYAGIGTASAGTNFATWSAFGPGQYFAFPVLNGGSYAISTCGAGFDTQLTGWNSSASSVVFYNDDYGPLCNSTEASIDNYVPNFTNYMYVQVTQYNCIAGGSSSINLYLRQNNNLSFTSSSSAMCSGQTRTLGATPANVVSTPGGYGNPGTFSGTGVSGNVFTAPTVTVATNYTVTYTFGYVSQTQVITVNPNPTVTVSNYNICSGNSLTLSPGGASTYTFTGGGPVVSPSVTTSYTVTGTSTAGCLSTNTAVINVSVNTTPTISVNSGSICAGNSFTILPSGANTYTIQGGTFTVSPGSTTSYTVSGTSAAGCVAASTATSAVTVNTVPVISVNSGSICAGNSFAIVPSGASTYTVQGGTYTVSPGSSTSYTVRGASTAGCLSSNTATSAVTVNTIPVISVNSGSICAGSSFTITPSGASTYTIQGGTFTVSPGSTASYTVSGTSAAGCVAASTATSAVTVNTVPVISVNSGSICAGNSFTITPSGANTYTIQGGTFTVSPGSTTSYTVSGTSAAGCVAASTATSSVTVNTVPVISVNSGSICAGNSFTITPLGANTYTIQGGTFTVSPGSTTSYTVSGTSAAGCLATNPATSTVVVNAMPSISISASSPSVCNGNTVTLTASGAATYTWTGAVVNGVAFSPVATTAYSVSGTSAAGCTSSISVVTVSVNPNPVINAVASSATVCSGNTVTLTVTGADTYTWSNNFSGSTQTLIPVNSSTYAVTGTNSLTGCAGSSSVLSVSVMPVPTVSIAGTGTQICLGETMTFTVNGASTYSWSNGATAPTIAVSPGATTVYTAIGTDINGCSSAALYTLTVDPCTALANANRNLAILIYPNPNNGEFTISADVNAEIGIYDNIGKLVRVIKLDKNSGRIILVKDLAKGVYFVTGHADGRSFNGKIVVGE